MPRPENSCNKKISPPKVDPKIQYFPKNDKNEYKIKNFKATIVVN